MQTILVVEDEVSIRQMIRMMLEMSGYRVIEAGDGLEGLEIASEAKPDLIVLDVMMPKLDGFSMCQALRKQPHTQDIPVIMISGDATTDRTQADYEVYADYFLRKPFQFDQLTAQLERLLEKSSSVAAC